MKHQSILTLIGKTPLLNMTSLYPQAIAKNISIWMKLERFNPGGSIKDRIALAMIESAEKENKLTQQSHIIEPTSGNTGIALAMICANKGYPLTLVMPETMSIERRQLMQLYGANIVLTSGGEGMKGAIEKAQQLALEIPNSFIPMQFENMANPEKHYQTTAIEILQQLPDVDVMVCGIGTGGHLSGISKYFHEKNHPCQIIAVEPATSSVLSGNPKGAHKIQGIGAGFIPNTLNIDSIDSIITVHDAEAFNYFKATPQTLGLSIGVSTGANLAAIEKIIPTLENNTTILTFCYDSAEKYLSMMTLDF